MPPLILSPSPPPLIINPDGVILVGTTRVTLDTVINVFKQGLTAEEITHRYTSLQLADVYATIAFYLKNQPAIEQYLQDRQKQAQQIRQHNEAQLDPNGIRDRLLARKSLQTAC